MVNELFKQVEKLSTAIGKQIINNESNIAVVKPVQGSGVKRAFPPPTVGSGVHCRYCNNNNHSSANCKFKENKNTRKSYYENNANMALDQLELNNSDFCGMADDGGERNRRREELDRSEAEMILDKFNTYNNLLKVNDFRVNSRDYLWT